MSISDNDLGHSDDPKKRPAKASRKAAQRSYSRAQAADRLGISTKQLSRHVADGMPVTGSGRDARFPWPDIRVWRDQWLLASGLRNARPVDVTLVEAEKRSAVADAETKELKLELLRSESVPIVEFKKMTQELLGRIKAQATTLRGEYASRIIGLKTLPEARSALDVIGQGFIDCLRLDLTDQSSWEEEEESS